MRRTEFRALGGSRVYKGAIWGQQIGNPGYIIENMKLDELAERRIFESTLIMLPTKFKGATGAPVRIIALL